MELSDPTMGPAVAAVDLSRDRKVRYQVLAAACSLAVLAYLHRLSFKTAAPVLGTELGLSAEGISYLMAAFLVAYGISEIPCGLIADKFGARNMLAALVICWSVATGAIACVAWLPVATIWPLVYLLALRFAFGFFQGGMFPAITRMLTDWMPTTERRPGARLHLDVEPDGRRGGPVAGRRPVQTLWGRPGRVLDPCQRGRGLVRSVLAVVSQPPRGQSGCDPRRT